MAARSMSPKVSVTENELLEELRGAMGLNVRPPGFLSCAEMAKELGSSVPAVSRRLVQWDAAGRLEKIKTVVVSGDGHRRLIPMYRLRPAQAKPKARRAK